MLPKAPPPQPPVLSLAQKHPLPREGSSGLLLGHLPKGGFPGAQNLALGLGTVGGLGWAVELLALLGSTPHPGQAERAAHYRHHSEG